MMSIDASGVVQCGDPGCNWWIKEYQGVVLVDKETGNSKTLARADKLSARDLGEVEKGSKVALHSEEQGYACTTRYAQSVQLTGQSPIPRSAPLGA